MTHDDQAERQRIRAAGFKVTLDGRVCHRCAAWLLDVHWQTLHRMVERGEITRVKRPIGNSPYSYMLCDLTQSRLNVVSAAVLIGDK